MPAWPPRRCCRLPCRGVALRRSDEVARRPPGLGAADDSLRRVWRQTLRHPGRLSARPVVSERIRSYGIRVQR
ncbi:hypothetical protein PSEUDO8AS_50054 [Pseudomonas sp. 8AS]|nr:hypothetical protein PSEUDO8AS_50054 [Pseudomonas sp. 8AS]